MRRTLQPVRMVEPARHAQAWREICAEADVADLRIHDLAALSCVTARRRGLQAARHRRRRWGTDQRRLEALYASVERRQREAAGKLGQVVDLGGAGPEAPAMTTKGWGTLGGGTRLCARPGSFAQGYPPGRRALAWRALRSTRPRACRRSMRDGRDRSGELADRATSRLTAFPRLA